MNKKFSTLLCASLLFSSAFSAVNAGNIRGYAQGSDAAAILKLDKAEWSVSVESWYKGTRWSACY